MEDALAVNCAVIAVMRLIGILTSSTFHDVRSNQVGMGVVLNCLLGFSRVVIRAHCYTWRTFQRLGDIALL